MTRKVAWRRICAGLFAVLGLAGGVSAAVLVPDAVQVDRTVSADPVGSSSTNHNEVLLQL
ncbi:hypothetical protein [Kribbella sp. NPDC051770]|uniref:hypothetical protein n=1 Tax=Kribbella sp. NPDC051770 TaxID=3155413 RepID=UPI003445DF05